MLQVLPEEDEVAVLFLKLWAQSRPPAPSEPLFGRLTLQLAAGRWAPVLLAVPHACRPGSWTPHVLGSTP